MKTNYVMKQGKRNYGAIGHKTPTDNLVPDKPVKLTR
jgi:hypothetical protein